MELKNLQSTIQVCSLEELNAEEQKAVELAIEGTNRSYTPYSHFHVGAGVILNNGSEFVGCNQENAAFPPDSVPSGRRCLPPEHSFLRSLSRFWPLPPVVLTAC